MRNRAATWVNLVFASIIVIGVFVQAYLIASYAMGAGEDALDMHGFVGGFVIHGSELLVFLSALVAFWKMWRWILVNLGLFVLGTVQIFLAPPDEDPASGWVHGFHGLLAILVPWNEPDLDSGSAQVAHLWRSYPVRLDVKREAIHG